MSSEPQKTTSGSLDVQIPKKCRRWQFEFEKDRNRTGLSLFGHATADVWVSEFGPPKGQW